ncbi:uncharacterized protein BJ171DRAFT_475605, partial [Polychytrium aggregatum]|uniref:uncharacterized protein n=1 Tax=Polychytrium aggregatum TaxID=110093 RepID=UPI0022FF3F2E
AASLSLRKDVMRYFSEALEMFIRSPPGSDCFFSSSALIKSGDLYGSVIRTVSPDPSPDAVDVGMHIHPKKEPLSVASSLAGMASVAALKGKFQIAYDLSKQVLSILITAQAPALLIARAHHNMGIVLRCLDHRGDAWEQLQQARDIYVGLHGTSDHRDMVSSIGQTGGERIDYCLSDPSREQLRAASSSIEIQASSTSDVMGPLAGDQHSRLGAIARLCLPWIPGGPLLWRADPLLSPFLGSGHANHGLWRCWRAGLRKQRVFPPLDPPRGARVNGPCRLLSPGSQRHRKQLGHGEGTIGGVCRGSTHDASGPPPNLAPTWPLALCDHQPRSIAKVPLSHIMGRHAANGPGKAARSGMDARNAPPPPSHPGLRKKHHPSERRSSPAEQCWTADRTRPQTKASCSSRRIQLGRCKWFSQPKDRQLGREACWAAHHARQQNGAGPTEEKDQPG